MKRHKPVARGKAGGAAPVRAALDERASALEALQVIPGVGPSIAGDLYELGLRRVADLAGKDPERLFRRHETLKGMPVDRCVLYTFRCAVYYASHPEPDPKLLRWWVWKDPPPKNSR